MSEFNKYRSYYLANKMIPFDQYLIFDKLYKSGTLHAHLILKQQILLNDFYHYLKVLNKNFTIDDKLSSYLQIVAKNNLISMEKLTIFIQDYVNLQFSINKNIWINQYEIDNAIYNDEDEKPIDYIQWAKTKLTFPSINKNPSYQESDWDRILESYIRAFSTNLLKNYDTHYLRVVNGAQIDKKYWPYHKGIVKSFDKTSNNFYLYSKFDTSNNPSVSYLVPVQLDWVLRLNPIYYFYFLYDKNTIIYKMPRDENILECLRTVEQMYGIFNYNLILSYLNTLANNKISKLVKNEIYQKGIKN